MKRQIHILLDQDIIDKMKSHVLKVQKNRILDAGIRYSVTMFVKEAIDEKLKRKKNKGKETR